MTDQPPPPDEEDYSRALTDDEIAALGYHRDANGVWVRPAPPTDGPHPTNRYRDRLYEGTKITTLPPLTPLVDGVLYLPGESVFYSPPKLAKTFFALDLALCVATGKPWMGRDVVPGPVLFVAAEGIGGLGARVQSWCHHHGYEQLPDAWFLTTSINLIDRQSLDPFLEIVTEIRPILVVLDTLARCTTGAEENSAKDMGQIVEALDTIRNTTRGHVTAIHHVGKDTTKGMRGSSALLGAVDTTIELAGDSRSIHCRVTAQKDAEPAEPWWCQLVPVGPSAVITEAAASDVSIAAQTRILAILEELAPEDRTSTKWSDLAEDAGISRRNFFRAKAALQQRGWVTGGGGRGALYQIADQPDTDQPF